MDDGSARTRDEEQDISSLEIGSSAGGEQDISTPAPPLGKDEKEPLSSPTSDDCQGDDATLISSSGSGDDEQDIVTSFPPLGKDERTKTFGDDYNFPPKSIGGYGSEEKHGQGALERYDPCFIAPVCYTFGTILTGVGVGMILYLSVFQDDNTLPHIPESVGSYVSFSVLIFFGWICLGFANYRVRFRLRSGQWAIHPTTKAEIIRAFEQTDPLADVAGEGWSFFISRQKRGKRQNSPPLVALRGNWSGIVRKVGPRRFRVKSGTLFGELTRIMDQHGECNLALFDRPQFDQMTVGGAVRTCAHGWNSQVWFIDSIVRFEAVQKGCGKTITREQTDPDFLALLLDKRYVLLEVDIECQLNLNLLVETKSFPSPEDAGKKQSCPGCCCACITCCYRGKDDGTALDLEFWNSAPYRMLFVYPDSIVTKTGVHSNDPCEAAVGNCALRLRHFSRNIGLSGDWSIVDSVADAHTVVQNVWASEAVFVTIFRHDLNTEIYTNDDFDLKGSLTPLTLFHRKWGGRTEIRVREVDGKKVYAIDGVMDVKRRGVMALRHKPPKAYIMWFSLLHDLGVRKAAIHRGKYIPPCLHPISEISMVDLFSNSNYGLSYFAYDTVKNEERFVKEETHSNLFCGCCT